MRKTTKKEPEKKFNEHRKYTSIISDLRLQLSQKNVLVREMQELFDRQAKEILRLQRIVDVLQREKR